MPFTPSDFTNVFLLSSKVYALLRLDVGYINGSRTVGTLPIKMAIYPFESSSSRQSPFLSRGVFPSARSTNLNYQQFTSSPFQRAPSSTLRWNNSNSMLSSGISSISSRIHRHSIECSRSHKARRDSTLPRCTNWRAEQPMRVRRCAEAEGSGYGSQDEAERQRIGDILPRVTRAVIPEPGDIA